MSNRPVRLFDLDDELRTLQRVLGDYFDAVGKFRMIACWHPVDEAEAARAELEVARRTAHVVQVLAALLRIDPDRVRVALELPDMEATHGLAAEAVAALLRDGKGPLTIHESPRTALVRKDPQG